MDTNITVSNSISNSDAQSNPVNSLLAGIFKSSKSVVEDCVKVLGLCKDSGIDTLGELVYYINKLILLIDKKINQQINEILHHPKLQKLEACWRGVDYLLSINHQDQSTKIKLLNVSWYEISRDLGHAIEFDQSQLFKKIYSEEFDTPGGEPYGAIVVDHAFSHRVSDSVASFTQLDILKELALIGEASLCPVIMSAHPHLLGVNDFYELGYTADIKKIFESTEYQLLKSFRQQEVSRFVALTMPSVLMRQPYINPSDRFLSIAFREDCSSNSDYLWGSAAYCFAAVLIRAYINTGWFADIRGNSHEIGNGGSVLNLEYPSFISDPNNFSNRMSTNLLIDDFLEKEFSYQGLMPLCSKHGLLQSIFYSNQSLYYSIDSNQNNASNYLSAMLQYLLCVCRFGHYIKVIGRDKIGGFISADDCQRIFQNWLNNYTVSNDASLNIKARYPLGESLVKVIEKKGRPGFFTCVIHLKPHFQLDQIMSTIKIVTDLSVGNLKSA